MVGGRGREGEGQSKYAKMYTGGDMGGIAPLLVPGDIGGLTGGTRRAGKCQKQIFTLHADKRERTK